MLLVPNLCSCCPALGSPRPSSPAPEGWIDTSHPEGLHIFIPLILLAPTPLLVLLTCLLGVVFILTVSTLIVPVASSCPRSLAPPAPEGWDKGSHTSTSRITLIHNGTQYLRVFILIVLTSSTSSLSLTACGTCTVVYV